MAPELSLKQRAQRLVEVGEHRVERDVNDERHQRLTLFLGRGARKERMGGLAGTCAAGPASPPAYLERRPIRDTLGLTSTFRSQADGRSGGRDRVQSRSGSHAGRPAGAPRRRVMAGLRSRDGSSVPRFSTRHQRRARLSRAGLDKAGGCGRAAIARVGIGHRQPGCAATRAPNGGPRGHRGGGRGGGAGAQPPETEAVEDAAPAAPPGDIAPHEADGLAALDDLPEDELPE